MKKFKKIFAAIAASALVAAMSFTSMAASITISRGDNFEAGGENSTEETHTYYKVLSAIKTSDGLGNTTNENVGKTEEIKGVSYQIKEDDPWFDVLNTDSDVKKYLKLTQSADKSVYVVEWAAKENGEAEAIKLANFLKRHLNDDNIKNTGKTFETEAKGLTDGYYLITSSLGTNLILATSDITIKEKNVYPTIDKFVDDGKSLADHNIGDMVPYTLKVTVPQNVVTDDDHQIVIDDTMDSVLKFNEDVSAVEGHNTTFTAFVTTKVDDHHFKITLNDLAAAKGKTITFTYTAELLKVAGANTPYANEATLSYSNYVTPKKIANVKTFAFELKKVNEDGNELGGAMFELRTNETDSDSAIMFVADATKENYVKADSAATTGSKTIEAGNVNIRGIKSGTYYLVETTAPQGYNVLDHAVEVKINDEGKILDKDNKPLASNIVVVENKKGLMLPSTGGMGTVAFAVVGLIVMAGAAVTLIIKKRA